MRRAWREVTAVDLSFSVQQVQTQRLAMTAQMRQALHVLELDREALAEYLSEAATRNVFLELRGSPRASGGAGHRNGPALVETFPAAPRTLAEVVGQQLRLDFARHPAVALALRLADDLDDRGYLDPYSAAIGARFRCTAADYEAAVRLIQSCDPAGVGARNLEECLRLQVHRVPDDLRALAEYLIRHALPAVAKGQWSHLARQMRVPQPQLQRAVDAIRQLNPFPGRDYQMDLAPRLWPDIWIQRTDDGYAVAVADTSGGLTFTAGEYLHIGRETEDGEVRQYLSRMYREARWLHRCIVQRGATLQRIGQALVELQPEFLERGRSALRPMTLRDLAVHLGMHESTISRAVRHKVVAVPAGTFELRSLCSAALPALGGTAPVSAEAVKQQIRQWVASEDPAHPLTDAHLAEKLAASGTKVSRRTVAKYRDALGIPGAPVRRRAVSCDEGG
ncbi:MAG: RNA polymerase factor sigma-54 [Alicyclobacillus sp.]|nr:RNA polymerase factor sigma-54 [Alicyclobacillus sp.]